MLVVVVVMVVVVVVGERGDVGRWRGYAHETNQGKRGPKGKERETTRKKKEHKDRRSSTATVYTHIYIYT